MRINKKVAGLVIVGALLIAISVTYISAILIRNSQLRKRITDLLTDLPDVDAIPAISKAQAIETVKDFLGSEAIKSRGYERCKILELKLTIAKPNYNFEYDFVFTPFKEEPTLVWYVCIIDRHRYRFDVMVDGQNGSIVGMVQYK